MFLVLCLCIGHFVILNFSSNKQGAFNSHRVWEGSLATPHVFSINSHVNVSSTNSKLQSWKDVFAFIHLNSKSSVVDDKASLLMIFPHSAIKGENTLEGLKENDQRALRKMSEFLVLMEGYDGATCLHNKQIEGFPRNDDINTARNISLESSWCRFITRKWSVNIRNTGLIQKVQLRKLLSNLSSVTDNSTFEETIVLQNCNILQGPFVIRKEVFHRVGGLLSDFGKITLLEFFVRSKGELKMAKLTNCEWTPEITRVDRGSLEGSNNFPEYASFGNKHQILRIVTENRIEWTACVANWKLCAEKPYVKPQGLPGIAAPICCSAVLGQMLADFTWALNKLGLEYRLIYGTLLGAVRSQAIIPWTHDIDIAISKSAIVNKSTFVALQKELGGLYYVGNSYMDTPRAHMLVPPYIEVDTAPFFDGPYDLEGNALFSDEIDERVKGMLPISDNWRERGYIDLYGGHLVWMNDSSLVVINNQTFTTVKEVDYELKNWYGESYSEPSVKGNWVGFSDAGTA